MQLKAKPLHCAPNLRKLITCDRCGKRWECDERHMVFHICDYMYHVCPDCYESIKASTDTEEQMRATLDEARHARNAVEAL